MSASVYADVADLPVYGLPATALATLTTAQKEAQLAAASALMDSKFRGRYPLPLSLWGIEVRQKCCEIAAWYLLNIRGYNPASGADENVRIRYADALIWLDQVQRSAAHPDVTPAPELVVSYQSPKVISSSAIATNSGITSASRGW